MWHKLKDWWVQDAISWLYLTTVSACRVPVGLYYAQGTNERSLCFMHS